MNGIFNIALNSLTAFQQAMNYSSQNIANVNTPMYSRRQVNFTEGLYNTGVNINNVARIYDQATIDNLQNCTSSFASSDILLRGLQQLEPLLDNDANNTAKYINDTISSLQQLNTDTSSIQARTVYLSKLTTLINQFQTVNSQVVTQQQTINSQLQSLITDANSIMANIAQINGQVANAPSTEDVSGLLDQRNQLIQNLSKYFNFTTETDNLNQVSISLQNGLQLVNATQVTDFSLIPDATYPINMDIAISDGSTNIPVNAFINGGQVSGLLTFRQTLATTSQTLGRLALAITQSLNTQNKLGMDYNGNLGGDIFTDINSSVYLNDRVIPNTANTGSGSITVNVNDLTQLTSSDYQLAIGSSNNYTLTRMSDGTVMGTGSVVSLPQTINVDGISITLNNSTFAAGDHYTISPTAGAISNMSMQINDPELLALGFPVVGVANTVSGSDGAIQITAMTSTTTSTFSIPKQLNPPLNIVFLSPTSYQIVNAQTNAIIEGPITYNPQIGSNVFPTPGGFDPGYRALISGSDVKTGDVFNITYNANGISDNRNGLAMAQIFSQGLLDNGTSNFIQAYTLLSGTVSQQTNAVETQYDSNQILQQQATNEFNQISAVDTQEETVNLMSYQQAYQASAQILQTAKAVFDDVIQMLR